jgi:hypothetical protein
MDSQLNPPLWRKGHPASNRDYFLFNVTVAFLCFLAFLFVHNGITTIGYFMTVAVLIDWLIRTRKRLNITPRSLLVFGWVWGYDLPYLVYALLFYLGLVR